MTTTNNPATSPQQQLETDMMEIGCPHCGNRYRLTIPAGGANHFHCVACDTSFTTRARAIPASPTASDATPNASTIIPQPTTLPPAPPPTAPAVRLWPWLMALLLTIAAIGGWTNKQQWALTPLLASIHAWWAPQRSIGWRIVEPRPQWIARPMASPLLAIGFRLHKDVLFDRSPPPLLLISHGRNSQQSDDAQLVILHQQPSLTQLEQPHWQPPAEDRTPIPAGGERSYTIVVDQPPKLLESVELTLH